jgi:hypothetical protein
VTFLPHRLWRRLPLWLRRRLRKRPPLEDMLWAWSAATWGWQIERKRWWRK